MDDDLMQELDFLRASYVDQSGECATYRTALALISRKSPNGHLGNIARKAMTAWDKQESPVNPKEG